MKTTKNKMILSLAAVLALGALTGCDIETPENMESLIAQNTATASKSVTAKDTASSSNAATAKGAVIASDDTVIASNAATVKGAVIAKDTDNGVPPTLTPEKPKTKAKKGWYVSTRVSVYDSENDITYEGTNPAVFGVITDGLDGSDKYDVPTFGSVVTRPAAVAFVQENWAERSGEYHSDYRGPKGKKVNWEMTVFSSVANAEVTLKWDGIYLLTEKDGGFKDKKTLDSRTLKNLRLVDTKTGEKVSAIDDGILNTYTFNMGEESSRTFIWTEKPGNFILSKSKKVYIETKQKEAIAKTKNIIKLEAKLGENRKFGLPPM